MIITSLPIQSSIDSTQISCKVNIMRGFSTCISAVRYFVSKITCSWCNFLCRGSAALRRSLLHSMRFMPGHNSPTCFTLNRVPQAYPSLHYACSRLARTFRQSEGLFSPHFPSSCRFTGGEGTKTFRRHAFHFSLIGALLCLAVRRGPSRHRRSRSYSLAASVASATRLPPAIKIESGYWFRPEYKSKDFLESVGSTLCDSTRYFVPALFAHLSQLRQCAFFYSNCVGTLPYIEFDLRRLALPSSRYPPCDHHLTSVMC